ncbi:hypothetical protein BCR44DRAFT_80356 [Catenaria anguillulae PL171]|uniref:Uncharacterized protein n=1 Tax=Catenaria anguillulae PL171 TaxID=765915 RepID=A0A1Y2HD25_9FUNG|nr:hypothetical protein BCR44DRAFT_80356 [Catenaria anguillulae PL171]
MNLRDVVSIDTRRIQTICAQLPANSMSSYHRDHDDRGRDHRRQVDDRRHHSSHRLKQDQDRLPSRHDTRGLSGYRGNRLHDNSSSYRNDIIVQVRSNGPSESSPSHCNRNPVSGWQANGHDAQSGRELPAAQPYYNRDGTPPSNRYSSMFGEMEPSLLIHDFQPRSNLPQPSQNSPYFHRYRSFNRCLVMHAILFVWGDLVRKHPNCQHHSLAFPRNLQSHSGHTLIRDIARAIQGPAQTMLIKFATWSNAHRRVQVIDVRLCDAILTLWPASLKTSKSLLQSIQTRLTKDMAGEPCQSIDGFAQIQPLLVRDPSQPSENAGFILDWTVSNAPYRYLDLSNRFPKVAAAHPSPVPTVRPHSSALPAPDPTAAPRSAAPPVPGPKQSVVVLSSSSSSSSSPSSDSSDSSSSSSSDSDSDSDSGSSSTTSSAPRRFDSLTEFNKVLILNTLLFTWSSRRANPVVIPSTDSHTAFDLFSQSLVDFAVTMHDLDVQYMQMDSDTSTFSRHRLGEAACALWGTDDWAPLLKQWIKEYGATVMGEADGHKGLVYVGNLETRPLVVFKEAQVGSGLAAAAASASAKDGEWVVNWAAQASPYVFKTTSVPNRSPERGRLVETSSSPKSVSAKQGSRKRTAFEAYSSSSAASSSSSDSSESEDEQSPQPSPHRPPTKRLRLIPPTPPSPTRTAATSNRSMPPRPPTAFPPPPAPLTMAPVRLVKVKPDPDAPPQQPTDTPADPLESERLYMRRLAQLNMTRFKLRTTYGWATDAWFREVQAHAEDDLTHDKLVRYADVTHARSMAGGYGHFGEAEAIKLVAKVVVYEMVSEQGYSPSTFMYVEELVEVGQEMGMGKLTREVVQELVGMLGDVE